MARKLFIVVIIVVFTVFFFFIVRNTKGHLCAAHEQELVEREKLRIKDKQ